MGVCVWVLFFASWNVLVLPSGLHKWNDICMYRVSKTIIWYLYMWISARSTFISRRRLGYSLNGIEQRTNDLWCFRVTVAQGTERSTSGQSVLAPFSNRDEIRRPYTDWDLVNLASDFPYTRTQRFASWLSHFPSTWDACTVNSK